MRKILMIAAGLAVLAGPALAQSSMSDTDRGGDRFDRREWRDRDSRGGMGMGRMMDRGRDDDSGGMRGGMRHGHHGSGGSAFFFRNGNVRFGMRCSENESLRSCVDAAVSVLDKARSLPSSPSGTGSGTGGSSPQ